MLKPDIDVPLNDWMRRFLDDRVQEIKSNLVDNLPAGSKVSVALDCWTNTTNHAFLAVVAYFIDVDWNYQEVQLSFRQLQGHHTGYNIARIVRQIPEQFELEHRLFTVTTDNASNNSTMAKVLAQSCIEFKEGYHLPCLSHVVQLAVKELLSTIKMSAFNEDVLKIWQDDYISGIREQRGFAKPIEKVSANQYLAIFSDL